MFNAVRCTPSNSTLTGAELDGLHPSYDRSDFSLRTTALSSTLSVETSIPKVQIALKLITYTYRQDSVSVLKDSSYPFHSLKASRKEKLSHIKTSGAL